MFEGVTNRKTVKTRGYMECIWCVLTFSCVVFLRRSYSARRKNEEERVAKKRNTTRGHALRSVRVSSTEKQYPASFLVCYVSLPCCLTRNDRSKPPAPQNNARVLQSASPSFVVFDNAGVPRGVEGCAAHTNVLRTRILSNEET